MERWVYDLESCLDIDSKDLAILMEDAKGTMTFHILFDSFASAAVKVGRSCQNACTCMTSCHGRDGFQVSPITPTVAEGAREQAYSLLKSTAVHGHPSVA